MSHLTLCKDHKQEWKQSEYAKENCNYCNALARIDELTAENERLKKDNHAHCTALMTTAMWEGKEEEVVELTAECNALRKQLSEVP
jgi:hypothetical protein